MILVIDPAGLDAVHDVNCVRAVSEPVEVFILNMPLVYGIAYWIVKRPFVPSKSIVRLSPLASVKALP